MLIWTSGCWSLARIVSTVDAGDTTSAPALGADSVTSTVSAASGAASSATVTGIVFVVSPAANSTRPAERLTSLPAVAVPPVRA